METQYRTLPKKSTRNNGVTISYQVVIKTYLCFVNHLNNKRIEIRNKFVKLFFLIFVTINIYGQKTYLPPYYIKEGREITSLYLATNLKEAYEGLERLSEILKKEKSLSLTSRSYFSSVDTIYEIIYRDTCKTCREDDGRYIINISRGLPIRTYYKIIEYARKMSLRNNYIDIEIYSYILWEIRKIFLDYIDNSKEIKKEWKKFFEKLIIYTIENGNTDVLSTKYYLENYMTDAVCKAIIKELKNPKHPSYLLEQYMEDNKDMWDPSSIDTTGLPKSYINNPYAPHDIYWKRYERFRVYDRIAKEKGITPQEALYQRVARDFYRKGFKNFSYIIDYVIETGDNRLLPAIKEFIRNYPEYELTEKQKEYFNNLDKK